MRSMAQYAADLTGVCGCAWVVVGSTSDEVVQKTKKHAAEAHHMHEVPSEVAQKLGNAIHPAM
jgi:predicted small metal-binding protein